jgi:3D (Asp-Asp-Asp) domain-containing protein
MYARKILRATETALAVMILLSLGTIVALSDRVNTDYLTFLDPEVEQPVPVPLEESEPIEDVIEDEPPSYEPFEATAYCDFGITYSGVLVHRGIVAADPKILPIGSVIEVTAGDYSGIYTVMDTGGVIKGRIIDIYVPDYEEAIQFGRQTVGIRVIRRGWQPDQIPSFEYTVAG